MKAENAKFFNWKILQEKHSCTEINPQVHEVLKILSYNILGDAYVAQNKYCEEEYLEFSYRGPQITKSIEILNPDIFCLQEVDHYNDYYQPILSNKYCLYYEIKNVYLKVGLLIGFKKNTYKLLKKCVISYDNYVTEQLFDNEKEIAKFKKFHIYTFTGNRVF